MKGPLLVVLHLASIIASSANECLDKDCECDGWLDVQCLALKAKFNADALAEKASKLKLGDCVRPRARTAGLLRSRMPRASAFASTC